MITSIIISVFIFVHIFFLIALLRKNFSVIDIGWGPGCFLAVAVAWYYGASSLKSNLLFLAVALWALRLGFYILSRGLGKGEDPRYTKLRNEWRPRENIQAYLKVFLLQGTLMIIVSLPATAAIAASDQSLSWINWLGLMTWGTGFCLEIWSDHFLSKWKAQESHRGKICTEGPWKICRFPNYFGEILLWYGIFLLGFSRESAWAVLGSLAINFFIVKVTGIPPLERKYMSREDYREYAKRVPRLIPFMKASS